MSLEYKIDEEYIDNLCSEIKNAVDTLLDVTKNDKDVTLRISAFNVILCFNNYLTIVKDISSAAARAFAFVSLKDNEISKEHFKNIAFNHPFFLREEDKEHDEMIKKINERVEFLEKYFDKKDIH